MMSTIAVVTVCAIWAVSTASSTLHRDQVPVHMRGGDWFADAARADAASDALVATRGLHRAMAGPFAFKQLVYHNQPGGPTFSQRWWVDTTNATSGGCFLYINGEGPAGGTPGGFIAEMAYQLGHAIYSIEHRWYGDSMPSNDETDPSFATLSVESEMADLAAFITMIRATQGCKSVGVVGGSYAGAVSAWFRTTHPELADWSWSSSGVVKATFFFDQFDEQIVKDLTPTCLAGMRAITGYAEAALDAGTASRAALFKLFNTPDYFTREDFLWMLADSGAMGPQYGYKDKMCTFVDPLPPTPQAALAAFADWTITHYGSGVAGACYYSTACLSGAGNPTMVAQWPDSRPWVYQCCSELAYWQVATQGSIRSQSITTDYFETQCKAAFGDVFPNTTSFNARFFPPANNATKVIALQGSDDPWQGAGITYTVDPVLYPEFTAVCDGCGHCGDLGHASPLDPPSKQVQHAAIKIFITEWANAALRDA